MGCPNKYIYATTKAECPNEKTPPACFKPYDECEKKNLAVVWETNLVKQPLDDGVLGCLNSQCCGVVVDIYVEPILRVAALSLAYLFIGFILACFCFNLSTREKSDLQLNKLLQIILFGLFLALLIAGILWVSLVKYENLPKKEIISAIQTVKINPDR